MPAQPLLTALPLALCCSLGTLTAQDWQQYAAYDIDVALDVETHRYTGRELIDYVNNSPDTLTRFFFHLYPNAFRPGSMMDVRSRSLPDPDRRVRDRIAELSEDEQGRLSITTLTQDGAAATVTEEGTVGVVELAAPILPGDTVAFALEFVGQVPVQIRRSGRDNAEGVDYSMPQWYPKVVEYDRRGWHANPYVAREFHGVWGDFDVTVALDADYVYASSGYVAEPDAPFYDPGVATRVERGDYALHRRLAPRVHDFTWAADPEYARDTLVREDGTLLEFYYLPGEATTENWRALPRIMDRVFGFVNERYGQYPYDKYAFVQGGDGGMEYAMMTLITGERSLASLVGVSVHELMHSWYQFVLATNESLYPWMDEGFTSFASAEVMNFLAAEGLLPGAEPVDNPHAGTAASVAAFGLSGMAEPLSTHADHFATNSAYGVASYSKGQLFLYQLRGVVGEEAFRRGMLRYFDEWKFRHPTPVDFLRVMEKESGQELDWYLDYMVNTTAQIDYAVDTLIDGRDGNAVAVLRRVGRMPFPVDVAVETTDGLRAVYHIPLVIQRGHAPLGERRLAEDWAWVQEVYELPLGVPLDQVARVQIDPSAAASQPDRANDVYPREDADDEESGSAN